MRKRTLARGAAAALALAACGCDASGGKSSVVHGALTSAGGALGDWRYTPDRCLGGDPLDEGPLLFVDLATPAEHRLRVALDPLRGPTVVVTPQGTSKRIPIDADSGCSTFDLQLL